MKKVLGTRYFYQHRKMDLVALILVGVIGLIFTVLPIATPMPLPFIAFGIVMLVVPVISYFTTIRRIQKQNAKLLDVPTIELSAPDTFTAYLFNGKVVDIKLGDIEQIKSTHRTQVSPGLFAYNITTFKDGTIKFILKDKTKVSVQYVNEVDAVAEVLLKLTRNPQAAAELFNTEDKPAQE